MDVVGRETGRRHRHALHARILKGKTGEEVEFVAALVEVIVQGILRQDIHIEIAEIGCFTRVAVLEGVDIGIVVGR